MAYFTGRLRAARCAAIAAESSTASKACSLFETTDGEIYPSWCSLPWVPTRSIVTSTAHNDSRSGIGGDSRRPDSSFRQKQWNSDREEDDATRTGPTQRGTHRRDGARANGPNFPTSRPPPRGDPDRPRWDHAAGGLASNGAAASAALNPRPGGSSSFTSPSSSALSFAQPRHQPKQWNLVALNSPQRVLQLIGDPRIGVADDTTTQPFGEVTVDMVHYQPSNEVYWFKYEFAGMQTHGSHRDARLSDYTRNLMYLMRAKNPERWTIEALAEKFRIRKQRVLAILALKELEGQRIEDGKLLSGPLSAYALPVHTADIHMTWSGNPRLEPHAIQRRRSQRQQSAAVDSEGAEEGALQEAVAEDEKGGKEAVAGVDDHIDEVVPRVVSAAHRLQLRLVELLMKYDYDTARFRTSLEADLDGATQMATRVVGESYLQVELHSYRMAVEAVVAGVEEVLSGAPLLMEERRAAALRRVVESALAVVGEHIPSEAAVAEAARAGVEGAVAPSEALLAAQEKLMGILGAVLQDADDLALQRAFFTFSPKTRGSLLRLLPELSIRLNSEGVDLARASTDASYRGPIAAAASGSGESAPAGQLPVDAFGFLPVPEQRAAALEAALQSLERARSALVTKLTALQPSLAPAAEAATAAAPSASDVQLARSLVRQYIAADVMWADLLAPSQAVVERRLELPVADPAIKRRMIEVLFEAEPAAVTRALQVEAFMQLKARRAVEEANALAAGVGAAAAAESGEGQQDEGDGEREGDAGGLGRRGRRRPMDRASWDALAAFLEAKVAGKVYSTGSGERHVVRLPTYPAFEGYSLEDFDGMAESEMSALNRQAAERLEEEMFDRFRKDLLYNLGLRGEKLRLSAHEKGPYPANLRMELSRPVVVYDIGPDGTTLYPPLFVATGDGKQRALNEQEKVFQERREVRERLPYYMGRIRRMPELD